VKRHELFSTVGVGLGASVLLGLMESTSIHAMRTAAGRAHNWPEALIMTLPSWILLAVTAPGILALARRYSFDPQNWRKVFSFTAPPA
jgi:hypothetical protein